MKNVVTEIAIENGGGNHQPIYDIMFELFDVGGAAKSKGFDRTLEYACDLWAKLQEIYCEKFYTKSGSKITKPLKAFLEEQFGKESVKLVFAEFCKRISNIYIEVKAEATLRNHYFTTNEGGEWNDEGSCFLDGGCNWHNGQWIDASPGIGVITIKPEKTYSRGRIIVWFIDSTTAHMVNVYSGREGERELPRSVFVKVLEAMSGTEISWAQKEEDTLNIYLNRSPMVLKALKGSFDTVCQNYQFKCTECSKRYNYDRNVTCNADAYLNACSHSCMDIITEGADNCECYHCGNRYYEDDMYFVNDNQYCDGCYNDLFFRCEKCNNDCDSDDQVEVTHKGYTTTICQDCYQGNYQECSECERSYPNNEMIDSQEGNSYCPKCVIDCCSVCADCAEIYDETKDSEDDLCPICLVDKAKEVA